MPSPVKIRPEQLLAVAVDGEDFVLGGQRRPRLPWRRLVGTHLYMKDVDALEEALSDAARSGYQILEGRHSDRRGLRSFTIGVGAWGWRGEVQVRTTDIWGLAVSDELSAEEWCSQAQAAMRELCLRLNGGEHPFRATAPRWISGVYREKGEPMEPRGKIETLPEQVANWCRAAHIGGPVVHARTSLEPFVRLDRDRAYGTAMLSPLPAGQPLDVPLGGPKGMRRWRPNDLMKSTGFADATVWVEPGPLVPLLPILKPAQHFERAVTLYPVGRFRGRWSIEELTELESSGTGRVEQLHRVFTFSAVPVFSGVVRYVRRVLAGLPIRVKRLEHMLYGHCARSLGVSRLGSAPGTRPALPRDLLDERSMQRLSGDVRIARWAVRPRGDRPVRHPILRLTGQVSSHAAYGVMDRPDRAAWITARNRLEMARLIRRLDKLTPDERPGSRVGRVYVDGIDMELPADSVPPMDGVHVRSSGPEMRLYRAGTTWAQLSDGSHEIDSGGTLAPNATRQDLERSLEHAAQLEGGPLAGGRVWKRRAGTLRDPRLSPSQVSEPFAFDNGLERILGFGQP